ncbi:MAG: GNAT family N-acetyltransferase [Pseudomonadota bacterium]
MITVRPAQEEDFASIEDLLQGLEIGHPSFSARDFQVASVDGEIAAVANLKDCGACFYLGAVGVAERQQGRGVARKFLDEILAAADRDVYLYTRIPEFFGRFGFGVARAPAAIPPREIYGCEACDGAAACVCMVRRADAP